MLTVCMKKLRKRKLIEFSHKTNPLLNNLATSSVNTLKTVITFYFFLHAGSGLASSVNSGLKTGAQV